jgi:hypothetical protein
MGNAIIITKVKPDKPNWITPSKGSWSRYIEFLYRDKAYSLYLLYDPQIFDYDIDWADHGDIKILDNINDLACTLDQLTKDFPRSE